MEVSNNRQLTPAFLIEISDPQLQEYAQKFSLANGPDFNLNHQLRSQYLQLRIPPESEYDHYIIRSADRQISGFISLGDRKKIKDLATKLGLPLFQAEGLISYFGWKVAHIPRYSKSILSFGCCHGHELIVIRALFPHAKISAVDYTLTIPPEWMQALNLEEAASMPIDQFLRQHPQQFDALFSNHVLEHFYNPETMLQLLQSSCMPNAILVSGMPLDGSPSNIFYGNLLELAREKKDKLLELVDMVPFSPMHPWKTNLADLAATLSQAGFIQINILSRANCPTGRPGHTPITKQQWQKKLIHGKFLYGLCLRPFQRFLQRIWSNNMPSWVFKLYFALDHRLWFGISRLAHETPEVLLAAKVPGQGERI